MFKMLRDLDVACDFDFVKPIVLSLNERKFNNLLYISKNAGLKIRLISKEESGFDCIYRVEIKDPISFMDAALDKNSAYESRLNELSKIEDELLFI